MKQVWMAGLLAALLGAGAAFAALTEADLTRERVAETMKATPAAGRQAYARQVIEAVAAQPTDDLTKTQQLISLSRVLIGTGGTVSMIAEVFNSVPMAYLQAVAETLGRVNFDQKANGMTDAQFDTFCAKVVSTSSRYIEASGTDSPAMRISILAATFTQASSDPDRTRPAMIAALPPAMQAVAATYIAASENRNRDVIAAAAGVDEVAATPADPDAGNVVEAAAATAAAAAATEPAAEQPAASAEGEGVSAGSVAAAGAGAIAAADAATGPTESADPAPAMAAQTDYLASPEPGEDPQQRTTDEGDGAGEVKVPLLARFAPDVMGLTMDTMSSAMYDWENPPLLPPSVVDYGMFPEQLIGAGEFGVAAFPRPNPGLTDPPMDLEPEPEPIEPPSPPYGNQGI